MNLELMLFYRFVFITRTNPKCPSASLQKKVFVVLLLLLLPFPSLADFPGFENLRIIFVLLAGPFGAVTFKAVCKKEEE